MAPVTAAAEEAQSRSVPDDAAVATSSHAINEAVSDSYNGALAKKAAEARRATASSNRQHHDIFGSAPSRGKGAAEGGATDPNQNHESDMARRLQRSSKNQTGSSVDPGHSPWATEMSSNDLAAAYEGLEKTLTSLITERTGLQAEAEKLHGRGGKTLRDRTRLVQVDMRLGEVEREISSSRKQLLTRPQ